MNKHYDYPEITLWQPETWAHSDAAIHPLVAEELKILDETVRNVYKTGKYDGRTDGVYHPKSNMRILPDVQREWEERGMEIHITSMGFVAWIAAVPKAHTPDTPVLLRFHVADLKDELWAMDTLDYYRADTDRALADGYAMLYLVYGSAMPAGIYMDIILELSALWRLKLREFFLDIRPLKGAGRELPTGFEEEDFHGVAAVRITDRWMACTAHQFICSQLNRHNPEFDLERLIHSTLGRKIAESMRWERDYRRWDDPGLLEEFRRRGLELEGHFTAGERWLTVRPAGGEEKLPLLICMKEVRPVGEFMAITALQFYHDQIEIAANGECMLLFFALESPDDNELLCDILKEAEELYPIDAERVYLTGQSHNGYFALEFARRHPELITAVATLNDRHGIGSPNYTLDSIPVTDEMIADYARHDLPLINICGAIENVFPHTEKGTQAYYNAIDAFHRRLRAFRCPDKSDERIMAALESADRAERINGIPGDRNETVYSMGFEAYISDMQNVDGRWHLRFVTLENLPHMISPQMAELSWSFLRRFARDGKSGEIREVLT